MNYNNHQARNPNAAERYPVITIRVVKIIGGSVHYRNYHQGEQGKVYVFRSSIGNDFKLVETLEPGKSYQVCQSVDKFNYTHWTAAIPYAGGKTMKMDAIMHKVATKKAERKVNEDLLLGFMTF